MDGITYFVVAAVGTVAIIAIAWRVLLVQRHNRHLAAMSAAEEAKAEERRREQREGNLRR